jgi:hypothetical protein
MAAEVSKTNLRVLSAIAHGHVYSRPWQKRVAHMLDNGLSQPERVTAIIERLESTGLCERIPGAKLSNVRAGEAFPSWRCTEAGIALLPMTTSRRPA